MGTVSMRLLLACALALAIGAETAGAQQDAGADDASSVEAPQPIPLSDIPERLQSDRAKIESIDERGAASAMLEPMRKDILELEKEVEAHRDDDLARIEEITSRRTLDGLAAAWAQRRARIGAFEDALASTGSALARDLGQLVELRARWEATREEVAAISGSEVLQGGLRDTLSRIDQSRRKLEQRIRPIMELETHLATTRDNASRVEQAIADARRRLRSQLFALDNPPLWSPELMVGGGDVAALVENLRSARDNLLDFAKERSPRFLLFAVLGAAFVAAMVVLRRSAAGWTEEDPHFAEMAGILARPFSGGALIVLMTGLLFVFPDAPDLVKNATAILLLWPLRRLFGLGILPGLQGTLYGIGAWFVVDVVRMLLLPESLVSRVVLVGESLGAILLIRWMRRPAMIVHLGTGELMLRAVGQALRLATPLLLVALIANLAGNVSLAELIVQGILFSLYLTYFVHAAVGVLKAAFGSFLHTRAAQHSRIVRYHRPLLVERGERLLQLVSTLLWVALTARIFRVDDLAVDTVSTVLTASFTMGQLELTLADFVLFGLMIWLSLVVMRLLRFVLEEDVLARARLPRGVPFAISTMVGYVVLVIGFLAAAVAAGFDIGRFTLVAGALGVGVGIGLQNVVNNFVSGLILLFERPIQLGDVVEVGQVSGTVKRIGLRSSTIRTYDGAEVVIPNSEFVSNQFINWTLSDRQRRIIVPVGIAYGTDPERVLELLLGAAKATPKVSPHPAPEAQFIGFGDSSLDFELRVWTLNFDDWVSVRTLLAVTVNTRLREAGIEIPFPQRDLHLRSVPQAGRGAGEDAAEEAGPEPD